VRDQLKTVGFAAAVCLVCSILLACLSWGLKDRQQMNRDNDIKKKVASVFGLDVVDEKGRLSVSQDELDAIFEETISGIVLGNTGEIQEGRSVSELSGEEMNDRDPLTGLKALYPLYVYEGGDGAQKRYAIHVSGKGLWSTVKGYVALESDLNTIAGVVIYEHAETPGLGGEVEKKFFLDRFKGKKWLAGGEVQRLRITKPGEANGPHAVDGITAATMTCRGVEAFLTEDFMVYNRYFEKAGLREERDSPRSFPCHRIPPYL